MPIDRSGAAFLSASAHRLAQIDPLLPRQPAPEQAFSGPSVNPVTCEARFIVGGAGGGAESGPIAVAHCEHWTGAPGSLDLVWGATNRFTLFPQIAGPDVADPLDQLIGQWRDHLSDHLSDQLAAGPEAGGEDTSAIINWPSRDIDGLNVMLAHGLCPLNVIAVHRLGRNPERNPGRSPWPARSPGQQTPGGLEIRRATAADLDVLTGLAAAEISYDAHFGGVIERPHAAQAMRAYLADQLTSPEPWIWVAERGGNPLGLLAAEPPEAASWIAPLTDLSPVAYLMSAFVDPAERGAGVGGALTREFHRIAQDAGVSAVLLHYELFNPRSGPFWSQRGYRPLWTTLEARPARRLR